MEAVKILRQLSRHPFLLALGMGLALCVAIAIGYRVTLGLPPKLESRQYTVGIAVAEVLVDSPNSQVADLGGGGVHTDITTLTTRARLLANLMAASPLKDQIARTARVDPKTFVASAPSLGPSPSQKPANILTSPSGPRANVLTVYFNETLPIITAEAQAPDEATAARISGAAVAELGTYLKSVAALDRVPDARRLVVDPLGRARSGTEQRGRRQLIAVAAFILVAGLWCAAIVLTKSVARRWRQVAQEESEQTASTAQASVAPAAAPAAPPASPAARRVDEVAGAPLRA